MKKYLFITAVLAGLTCACNNNSETKTTTDTTTIRSVPDNTRVRDTASYERMPQKTIDSLQK